MKKIIFLLLSLLLLAGCQGNKDSIRIAEQYGLAYAPLQIMKAKKILEKKHPEIEVEWLRLGNTTAIREAVLAGDLDVGFMGIPPFLIAKDKGMPWKIACGLTQAPLGLMVAPGEYTSLKEFKASDKIALPQPGSIQHILLSMAAERESGNPALLDNNLVALKHPDGMNALLSGAVKGHFTSPPYLFQEQTEGFECLVSGEEAMGGAFTFIAGAVTEKFYQKHNDIYHDFIDSLKDAIRFIEEEPDETLRILSEAYSLDENKLETWLYFSDLNFKTEIDGLDSFIDFMYSRSYLENHSRDCWLAVDRLAGNLLSPPVPGTSRHNKTNLD